MLSTPPQQKSHTLVLALAFGVKQMAWRLATVAPLLSSVKELRVVAHLVTLCLFCSPS